MAMLESTKRKATISLLDKLRADGMPGRGAESEQSESESGDAVDSAEPAPADDVSRAKRKKKIAVGVQDPEGLPSETAHRW